MQDENENGLTPAEREVASALGGLRPAPAAIDRDGLMFQAGRASMRRAGHLWQATAAVLAVGLCLSVAIHQPTRETVRVVQVTAPPSQATAPARVPETPAPLPHGRDSYIYVRSAVLARGLSALPTYPPSGTDDETERVMGLIIRRGNPRLTGSASLPGT